MIYRNLKYTFQNNDSRDYSYTATLNGLSVTTDLKTTSTQSKTLLTAAPPPSFVISRLSTILNQGSLGDCVSNAFAFCINIQTNNYLNMSRIYHYAVCRILQNTPLTQDSGTSIRTACKAISSYGALDETTFPYNPSIFKNFPPLSTFQASRFFKKFTYVFVTQTLDSIKNCLVNFNVPIIFGIRIYSSFLTQQVARTGVVPLPNRQREAFRGGHCLNIVGYNDSTKRFVCVNSWGKSWGNNGICYLPYGYVLNSSLAADFCFTQFIF
jgi:C1A family cysteine protease